MIDVLRQDGDRWRYVCLREDCGYLTRPTSDRAAAMVRGVHRHRHAVGLAPIPWHPGPVRTSSGTT